jgi:predicted TIM-barrel fold metal-dependent hydrolase
MTGPASDAEVTGWVAGLGLPGLVDLHLHFLPDSVQRKVWAFFDRASTAVYGTPWPIRYRLPADERLAILRELGVIAFAPLVYPHKPGMAAWLNDWVREFAAATPEAVPTATMYPEPEAVSYVDDALSGGIRCMKVHVQVGGFDPRDALLDKAWGMIADAGVPAVVHCGHGPVAGEFTGLDVFEGVLARHPRLTAVLAHAGMPEIGRALDLVQAYPRVHLDTTMVGVPFNGADGTLPPDWISRLVEVADRVALGTDFPSIPYPYATQLAAIAGWAAADDRLGEPFLRAVLHDTPARLLGLR